MQNVRRVIFAIAALATILVPIPAKSLPSQGGSCGSECSRYWDPDGTPHVSCDPGNGQWAGCTPIIYCDRDEYGRRVNCEGQCEGTRCYWV
jgi:hypothetical protein